MQAHGGSWAGRALLQVKHCRFPSACPGTSSAIRLLLFLSLSAFARGCSCPWSDIEAGKRPSNGALGIRPGLALRIPAVGLVLTPILQMTAGMQAKSIGTVYQDKIFKKCCCSLVTHGGSWGYWALRFSAPLSVSISPLDPPWYLVKGCSCRGNPASCLVPQPLPWGWAALPSAEDRWDSMHAGVMHVQWCCGVLDQNLALLVTWQWLAVSLCTNMSSCSGLSFPIYKIMIRVRKRKLLYSNTYIWNLEKWYWEFIFMAAVEKQT